MLADYHLHCEFSDDSEEPMEDMVRRAIILKFDEICFTDHVDYGVHFDHDEPEEVKAGQLLNVDYPAYFAKLDRLRKKYEGQISIKQGLEFGVQTHTIEKFQKLYEQYELDFIILSCHQVGDLEFWNYDFQKGKTDDESNAAYYQEIYDCICAYKDYSVLGHLDMIQRHNEPVHPFEKSEEIITKILKQAIADGKGIEVNTSSFRYGLRDLTPSRKILKLYYKLGGKIITFGSDGHWVKDMGAHIPYVREEMKKIGFREFCTFDRMQPIFHTL